VEIAPGPASIGTASGVMAMSIFCAAASVSSCVSCVRERCALSMSSATRSRMMLNKHENPFAHQSKREQHARHDKAGHARHALALLRRIRGRDRQETRHHRDGIDDDKEGTEGEQGEFEESHREP